MAIMRSSDFYHMVPSLFDNFMRGNDLFDWNNFNFSGTNSTLPAINVRENEFAIEVAAPGMNKDDFKVNVEGGILTISSEKSEEKKFDGDENYKRKEFSYQSFRRSFSLPENMVDGDKIQARYENGILQILLPKKEDVKPRAPKEIKVS